jgi:hypothetical protein
MEKPKNLVFTVMISMLAVATVDSHGLQTMANVSAAEVEFK